MLFSNRLYIFSLALNFQHGTITVPFGFTKMLFQTPHSSKVVLPCARICSKYCGGIQTGLETASAKLIKKHMPWKVKPFSPEEWPRLVRDGIKLLNDNYYFALNTMIVGLPGEEDDDVRESIELIKSLNGMATIIAPMLYTDYHDPEKTITASKMTKLQWELYHRCWIHNAKTVSRWIWYGTADFNPLFRIVATLFVKLGAGYALRLIRDAAKKDLGVYLS
jgi:radical SAM superfamily enzyme YgiQ (UPF0313 family)